MDNKVEKLIDIEVNAEIVKQIVEYFERETTYLQRRQNGIKPLETNELVARRKVYDAMFVLGAGAALKSWNERRNAEDLKWAFNTTMERVGRGSE